LTFPPVYFTPGHHKYLSLSDSSVFSSASSIYRMRARETARAVLPSYINYNLQDSDNFEIFQLKNISKIKYNSGDGISNAKIIGKHKDLNSSGKESTVSKRQIFRLNSDTQQSAFLLRFSPSGSFYI
jgi:hypothetical protein